MGTTPIGSNFKTFIMATLAFQPTVLESSTSESIFDEVFSLDSLKETFGIDKMSTAKQTASGEKNCFFIYRKPNDSNDYIIGCGKSVTKGASPVDCQFGYVDGNIIAFVGTNDDWF